MIMLSCVTVDERHDISCFQAVHCVQVPWLPLQLLSAKSCQIVSLLPSSNTAPELMTFDALLLVEHVEARRCCSWGCFCRSQMKNTHILRSMMVKD